MAYERIKWVNKEDPSFAEGSSPTISTRNLNNLQDGIEERILRSGDTMTGALRLYGNPQTDYEAATKKYVDDIIAFVPGDQLIASKNLGIASTGDWAPHKAKTYLLSKNSFLPRTNGYVKGEITVPQLDFYIWKPRLGKKAEFSNSYNVKLDIIVRWGNADRTGDVYGVIEDDSAIWENNNLVIYKETDIDVYENLENVNSIICNSQKAIVNVPVFKNISYGANMYVKFTSYIFGGQEDEIGRPNESGCVFRWSSTTGNTSLYMGNSVLQIE